MESEPKMPMIDKNHNVIVNKVNAKAVTSKKMSPSKYKGNKTYEQMVVNAIVALKDRNGSSLQGIKKYITAEYLIPLEHSSKYILKSIKKGVDTGALVKVGNKMRYKLGQTMLKSMNKSSKPKQPSSSSIQTKKTSLKKKNKAVNNNKENIEPQPSTSGLKAKKDKKEKTKSKKESNKKNDENKNVKKDEKKKPQKRKIMEDKEPTKKAKGSAKKMSVAIVDNLKEKANKAKTPAVIAGDKLKKKARKSLIRLSMKKSKDTKETE